MIESPEKTFRHSFGKLAWMFLGALFFGFIVYTSGNWDLFTLAIIGIFIIVAISYAASSVRISNDEIETRRLLGSKSLRWSEIFRVSMRGQSLRLHNRDEDVTLSLDSQLDGYTEILDIVFNKRPDLFEVGDNNIMTRSVLGTIFTVGVGFLLLLASVFLFITLDETGIIIGLSLAIIGLILIGSWMLGAQRLELESQTMTIVYLYRKVSYTTSDINSITLEKRRTKNGYIYFVQANLSSGKKLRIPTFQQGSSLVYQLLKRWHSKGAVNQPFFPS
jgi:hypothetical protein